MISVQEVEKLHNLLIETFGGSFGIRDRNALESALSRPFQTFEGKDLYETVLDKAASLIESILTNHPFVDGNKRTGYTLMRLYLLHNGMDVIANPGDKYEFVINIAAGTLKYQGIVTWLNTHTNKKNGA